MTLEGRSILLVEDDMLILHDLKRSMEQRGATVVTARSVSEGLARLDSAHDAAILDVRLGEEDVYPVAHQLVEQNIPFVFHSAIAESHRQSGLFPDVLTLPKPVAEATLINAMIAIIEGP